MRSPHFCAATAPTFHLPHTVPCGVNRITVLSARGYYEKTVKRCWVAYYHARPARQLFSLPVLPVGNGTWVNS